MGVDLTRLEYIRAAGSFLFFCFTNISVYLKLILHVKKIYNKRAQRALGCSPEEKVKGNSAANYREPQGHNLNNFGRGPFDDVKY